MQSVCYSTGERTSDGGAVARKELANGELSQDCQRHKCAASFRRRIIMRRRALRLCSQLSAAAGVHRSVSTYAVLTYGSGTVGALGHADTSSVDTPRRVEDNALNAALRSCPSDAAERPSVSAGLFHSAAAVPGVGAFSFGKGAGGRLGQGDEDNVALPSRVELTHESADESHDVSSVACGGLHSAFITRSGRLYTAGFGAFGALGHGNFKAQYVAAPVRFPTASTRVARVATGGAHTVAVTTCGSLYAFGRDEGDGRLGAPVGNEGVNSPTLVVMPPLPGVGTLIPVAAAAGGFHTLVLARAGDERTVVLSSGGNANGECGRDGATWTLGPLDWQSEESGEAIVRIAAGGFHSAALTSSGALYTWGAGGGGGLGHGDARTKRRPHLVEGLPVRAAAVSCGSGTTAVVGVDGSLWLWGKNASKFGTTCPDVLSPQRVDVPSGMHAVDVALGASHMVILCRTQIGV